MHPPAFSTRNARHPPIRHTQPRAARTPRASISQPFEPPSSRHPRMPNARLVLRLPERRLKNRDNEYGSDASSAVVIPARSRGARSLLGKPLKSLGRLDSTFLCIFIISSSALPFLVSFIRPPLLFKITGVLPLSSFYVRSIFYSIIHASAPSLIPAAARHPYAAVHRPSSDRECVAGDSRAIAGVQTAFVLVTTRISASKGPFDNNARAERPAKCEILICPGPHGAGRAVFGDAATSPSSCNMSKPSCGAWTRLQCRMLVDGPHVAHAHCGAIDQLLLHCSSCRSGCTLPDPPRVARHLLHAAFHPPARVICPPPAACCRPRSAVSRPVPVPAAVFLLPTASARPLLYFRRSPLLPTSACITHVRSKAITQSPLAARSIYSQDQLMPDARRPPPAARRRCLAAVVRRPLLVACRLSGPPLTARRLPLPAPTTAGCCPLPAASARRPLHAHASRKTGPPLPVKSDAAYCARPTPADRCPPPASSSNVNADPRPPPVARRSPPAAVSHSLPIATVSRLLPASFRTRPLRHSPPAGSVLASHYPPLTSRFPVSLRAALCSPWAVRPAETAALDFCRRLTAAAHLDNASKPSQCRQPPGHHRRPALT
ncbi:hypothetical protein GGX14DRAFT_660832 [Mycena pura]|uniref:Uncharacterized protein n=1 Tax=Mycena pura TaxID=153505 RepID=A0AAD6Y8W6_9AGAR|nr:hypothetical protein GGX14DRAFT_660832 [Mycena pura]